ncbi:hypothetical protein BAUCODRAFT_67090 [Baudoinia panamericana UAMH 10762]|uniref:Uncharacterized protein n=1 Tax=Baudoinia panamericana (strain UAMH 10762) TaxID=717646 RepID=M2NFS8_BAUPA|nr:uncharacterized protein BAUCODRAFT_67090 [Baudoinia panamericana UAMH 10762]EMC97855.1 hypothetical protein BAUCODRAFT_67090 [Baudoinia panamericana UAMH 10762]
MAKTPKVKKREVSFRSRAARRGISPPPKDLAVKAPVKETDYKPWLHNTQTGGISKKTKVKQLSRGQKLRQQRALEKADATVNKLERKVADSKARSKKIQARAKDWNELNGRPAAKGDGKVQKMDVDAVEGGVAEQESEESKLTGLRQPLPSTALVQAEEPEKMVEEVDEVT